MKFLVDENIPTSTSDSLRTLGHDVREVRGSSDEGASDDTVWRLAQEDSRVLVTTDKGFLHHRGELHHGILIVRLRQPNREKIHERVLQAVERFADEHHWVGLTVVMRDRVQSISRSSSGRRE